jgi:hypothetical protein
VIRAYRDYGTIPYSNNLTITPARIYKSGIRDSNLYHRWDGPHYGEYEFNIGTDFDCPPPNYYRQLYWLMRSFK